MSEKDDALEHAPHTLPGGENTAEPESSAAYESALARIEAQFIEEYDAGKKPSIFQYLQAYPRYAEDLLDLLAVFEVESRLLNEAASVSQSGSGGAPTPLAYPGRTRSADTLPHIPDQERLVAEQREAYRVSANARTFDIGAQATRRGLSLDDLAVALNLSPALLLWMDATALHARALPTALIDALAAQISVTAGDIEAWLGGRHEASAKRLEAEQPDLLRCDTFAQAVSRDTTLTAQQRAHWLNVE